MEENNNIIITPNGITLSYMEYLGKTLQILAETIRDAYTTGDMGDVLNFEDNLEDATAFFGLPKMLIDCEFIEKARQAKGLTENELNK